MSEFIIALHALVLLAHHGGTKSSEELSDNLCTNPVRIRKVMAMCKKHGLVLTKSGVNGGYMIGEQGGKINLKQIYDAIGTPLVESKWHSGNLESECPYCACMGKYVDELFLYLNNEMSFILEKINLEEVGEKIEKLNHQR